MFVFDLFEKKKQDAAAGRFVGGTSQDARVKNALDNAYRAVPAAKSPEEAALGYIDIQNSLNQKQDQVLDQQTKTNQQQTQQINDLVGDMRRKENDFRNLNAQIASMPNVTPQQAARMAQDIEAAHSSDKGEPVDVPNVVAKQTAAQPASQPAKTVAAPGPGASVSQLANYQQAKDQGAATAKTTAKAPQATPAPTTSKAIGQMANTIANAPVSKTNTASPANPNQPAPTQPAQPASNVVDFATKAQASKADKEAKALAAFGGQKTGTNDLEEQAVPSGAGDAQIAAENEKTIVKAYIGDTDANLTFLSGPPLKLKVNQVQGLVNAFTQIPNGMNKDALKINLFSNRSFLIEWMFENVVNPATATNRPTDVDQTELNQGQLALEGDVVPMTQDQSVLQAYNDVLEILKASKTKQPDVVAMMRQDWAGRYKQRFQISTAPDGNYYMLDKTTDQRHRLPDPRTFPMEDNWHAGDNAWSSDKNLWTEGNMEARLTVGDPITVTAPNEFEGKTGEIAEFSPSGKFVIVNLYNHGEHSMHLSDVEYNKYADDEVDEGAESSPVAGAITRRILTQRLDLLKQHGPELVGAAVDNVADYVGDVEEIGSSDVSGWVAQVERMLKDNPPEAFREGWSDAMVAKRTGQPRTPYSVYIKGKKWKDFENDDHAEAVANKLRDKFKADGRDPGVITIAPTDMSEGVAEGYNSQFKSKEEAVQGAKERVKTFRDHLDGIEIWAMPDGGFDQVHTMNANGRDHCIKNGGKKIGTIYPPKPVWIKEQGVAEAGDRVDPILIKALNRMPDGLNSHGQVLNAAYDAYAMELGRMEMKSNYGVTNAYIPQLMDLYKDKYGLDIKETVLNPRDPADDYAAKRRALQDLGMNKDVDQAAVLQRRLDLDKEAKSKGVAENFNGEYDDEAGMFKNDLQTIQRVSTHLEKAISNNENLPEWCQSKIAQAKGMIVNVMDYMISQHENGIKPKQDVAEEWSKKYKSSINCSHPKGFSQKAHCAGKKKSNESVDMEMVCESCGMCETHGNVMEIRKGQKDSNGVTKCWPGYEASGTKKGKNGPVRNCVKKEGVAEAETDFFKRRARERKVDAGQPVTRQPKNPQTDYARKRAKDKRDMELGESTNYWTRLQNERNTKIASLVSELTESVKKIK